MAGKFFTEKFSECIKSLEQVLKEDQGQSKYREVMDTAVLPLDNDTEPSAFRFKYFFFVGGTFNCQVVSVDGKFFACHAGTYNDCRYEEIHYSDDEKKDVRAFDLSYLLKYRKALMNFIMGIEIANESFEEYNDSIATLMTPDTSADNYFYSEEHQKLLKLPVDLNIMKKIAKRYLHITLHDTQVDEAKVDKLADLIAEHQKKYHSDDGLLNDPSFELFYAESEIDDTWALRDEHNNTEIYLYDL